MSDDNSNNANNAFDYAIIGAGPAGLITAWYLARDNKKVLLIDRESTIGGCHRVRRVNTNDNKKGLFAEHGPRVTIDNYFELLNVLSQININFEDLYTKYDVNDLYLSEVRNTLSLKELLAFAYEFMIFIFYENRSRNITMKEFTS